jgi:hypothetical protein
MQTIATLLNNTILLQEYKICVVLLSYVAARTPRCFSCGARWGAALAGETRYCKENKIITLCMLLHLLHLLQLLNVVPYLL